ncbi:MAG: hypothetical protein WA160_15025 [Pseudobdellovibrio sp.]
MFKKTILSVSFLFSILSVLPIYAHEGHDNTPGGIKANHGGVVKAGKEINLEFVVSGIEVKLYPANHDGKDLLSNEVKIRATAKLPKGKAESIKLSEKDGAFVASLDFKSSYRIEMNVEADVNGKKSSFKFQVEK